MKTKFSNALSLALIMAMLMTSVGLADEVANDIDNTIDSPAETRTITSGNSTIVGFFISATTGTNNDVAGCNVDSTNPATVYFDIPSGVTASTASLTFIECGLYPSTHVQNITFSSSSVGTHSITVNRVEGGIDGSRWTLNTGRFNLVVQAPTIQPQTITVTTPAPASAVYGSNFGVAAIASSGLPVAITTGGVCSGSGSGSATVTMTSGTGTCSVFYNQAGNASYNPAPQVTSNTAALKANPSCSVSGYSDVYDGASHGATGSCSGTGTLNLGDSFVNVPGGTANWSYSGDDNYLNDSGSASINITTAPVTATAGSGSTTYDDATHSPSACSVTGYYTGDLSCENSPASVGPDAGTTAIAPVVSGTGLTNFDISLVNGSYEITQAPSTVTVTCGGPYTYTGSAQTPCTAEATGVGMSPVDVSSSLVYSNNTNAGTATADASWGGDANHFGNTGSGSFTIEKANASCTVTGYSVFYDGFAHTATGSCIGVLGESLDGLNLSGTTRTLVGNYNDAWTFTDVTGNYNDTSGTVNDVIEAWTIYGFYAPVDKGIHNIVKGGATVPLKFEVFAGPTELTDTSIISAFTQKIACAAGAGDAIEQYSTGNTSLRYDTTSGQFIFNWKTLKAPGSCYRVTMTTSDGSSIFADFTLK